MNSHQIRFDEDLVRRYDRSGPRYTSYPTAVQFSDRFGVNEYRAVAVAMVEGPAAGLAMVTGWSIQRNSPEVGCRTPATTLIKVLFPAPFGPTMPTRSPSCR